MSLGKIIARNVTANWLGFAVHAAVTFFLTPFVLAELGEVRYGLWCLVIGLTGYYGLFDLGARAGLTQYITRYLAVRDFKNMNAMASTGMAVLAVLGCLIVLSLWPLALLAERSFSIPASELSDVKLALILVGTSWAVQLPLFTYAAALFATQRYDISNCISIASRLLSAGLVYVALRLDFGILGAGAAVAAGNTFDYLARWRAARRVLPELCIDLRTATRRSLTEFTSFSIWNVLIAGSRQLITYSDIIVIGFLCPATAIAPFALSSSLAEYFNSLIAPLAAVFFPLATQLDAVGDRKALRELYRNGSRVLLSVALVSGIVAVIWAGDFFRLWIGANGLSSGQEDGLMAVFQILMAASAVAAGQRIGYQVLLGTRRVKTLSSVLVAEGLVNIVTSVILARRYGIVGVALGTLGPAIMFQGLVHPVIVSRVLGIPLMRFITGLYTRPVVLGCMVFPTLLALRGTLSTDFGWSGLILRGALSCIVATALLVYIALTRLERSQYVYVPLRHVFTYLVTRLSWCEWIAQWRETRCSVGSHNNAIIFLSAVFPPDSAVGALRVGKVAHGLHDFGWDVHVVKDCPAPRNEVRSDSDAVSRPNDAVSVELVNEHLFARLLRRAQGYAACLYPSGSDRGAVEHPAGKRNGERRGPVHRMASLADRLLRLPDDRIGWALAAHFRAVRTIRQKGGTVVIFSSGPPHSAHVAAAIAKWRTGAFWVADLRDPWTGNPYDAPLEPIAERWNRFIEMRSLSLADTVLCNTEAARMKLASRFPHLSERIIAVPNGYDEEDFCDLTPKPLWDYPDAPVLVYCGNVYGPRDPSALLQAIGVLYSANPKGCPRLVFLGEWSDERLRQAETIIAKNDLGRVVTISGRVPRNESLAAQAAADGLVLLGDSSEQMVQVPAKLFECLRIGRPILSLYPEASPVNDYLHRYAKFFVQATPDNPSEIAAALQELASGSLTPFDSRQPIEELDRRYQIKLLHAILSAHGTERRVMQARPASADERVPVLS